jgi:DNA replicative helicase MCM subunit Mcm2 (Cdc46/Mcm family)
MSKPYFAELFQILDYNRLYYEVQFSYDTYRHILQKHEDDEFVFVLIEIFSNFQYDASAIIKSLSLILHVYIAEIKKQKEKKVCLVIENFPETNINDIKAGMIDNYITFEAVVLKVFQTKLMPISIEF